MNKRLKTALLILAALLVISTAAFFIYASFYYKADATAVAVLTNNESIIQEDNLVVIPGDTSGDTALIFYPGAKVEAIAYLPILEKINETSGITCILVEMPLRMAIFDKNAADDIFGLFPEVTTWYIGGHSMGGAMASSYASDNPDEVDGLILMGAYLYGDFSVQDTLTIYGSLNTSVAEKVDYTENVVVIEGGNHAQFGNYGEQKGDTPATISREAKQDAAVDAVDVFISEGNN